MREGLEVGAGERCWWSWSGLNILRVEDASWAEGGHFRQLEQREQTARDKRVGSGGTLFAT